jgi:hypothetical protein
MNVWRIYKVLLGLFYTFYGLLQIYNGILAIFTSGSPIQFGIEINNVFVPNVFSDPFAGLGLVTVGALLFYAAYYDLHDKNRSQGYLLAAWILAISLLLLNVVEFVANILDAYYPLVFGLEPNYIWSLDSDAWGISPQLVLGIFMLPFYFKLKLLIRELFPSSGYIGAEK